MSEIDDERAGLASGLMTTAHEIGGAFGVSIFSAIAVGFGAVAGPAFVADYGEAAPVATAIAPVLALVAFLSLPAFRPVNVGQASMH